jgi:hypothetical protein
MNAYRRLLSKTGFQNSVQPHAGLLELRLDNADLHFRIIVVQRNRSGMEARMTKQLERLIDLRFGDDKALVRPLGRVQCSEPPGPVGGSDRFGKPRGKRSLRLRPG